MKNVSLFLRHTRLSFLANKPIPTEQMQPAVSNKNKNKDIIVNFRWSKIATVRVNIYDTPPALLPLYV